QIEGVTSQYGFISKHPTIGMPSQSPFVAEAQSYLKLSNTLWLQIDQIVKENCAESYRESPHEDLLESLLDG
ncbi:MAG: terminase, partial [Clostridia bacterium]|nr:terminase [Clostridia bacterium]